MAVGSRSADDYSFGDGGAGQLGTRGRRQPALYAAHVQLADAPVAALYDRRHPALFGAWRAGAPGIQPDGLSGRRQRFRLLFAFVGADSRLEERDAPACRAPQSLATVALLANVVREMIALFGMPLFARWGGPLAPISVSGVTSMDVCLPSIARYSGSDLVPLAILHGIVLEVCVPILVGAFLLTEGTVKKNRQKLPFYRHLSGSRESPAGDRSVVNRIFRQNRGPGVLICRPRFVYF